MSMSEQLSVFIILLWKERKRMKKTSRKLLVILSLLFVFSMGFTSLAATHSFTFSMHTRVLGSTKYSLSDANTKVTATANTYQYGTNTVVSNKLNYHVNLHKVWSIGKYGAWKSANGKKVTWNLGDLTKGTYNIDLETNQISGAVYGEVKGSGNIIQ